MPSHIYVQAYEAEMRGRLRSGPPVRSAAMGQNDGVPWSTVEDRAPELARAVERCFGARRMKCLATMRDTGWPRLSETSGVLVELGQLWLALIPSAKARDLRADPRVGVHCGSPGDEWGTSARVTGWARPATPELRDHLAAVRPALTGAGTALELVTVGVTEVVVTGPDPETGHIAIEWWSPAVGTRRSTRPGG